MIHYLIDENRNKSKERIYKREDEEGPLYFICFLIRICIAKSQPHFSFLVISNIKPYHTIFIFTSNIFIGFKSQFSYIIIIFHIKICIFFLRQIQVKNNVVSTTCSIVSYSLGVEVNDTLYTLYFLNLSRSLTNGFYTSRWTIY